MVFSLYSAYLWGYSDGMDRMMREMTKQRLSELAIESVQTLGIPIWAQTGPWAEIPAQAKEWAKIGGIKRK